MTISHENIIDSLKFQSKEVLIFSNLLLLLQILIAIPAIISIAFPGLNSVILLTMSLLSNLVLCYYWRIKYKYLGQKIKTNDSRRALMYKFGFSPDLILDTTGISIQSGSESSGSFQGVRYNIQNENDCRHFLGVLLIFSLYNKMIYNKCEDVLRWFLLFLLVIVIFLFGLIIAFAGDDINVTIARTIISVVILFFSSDILNMIFHHRFVSVRLNEITERLLLLEGNESIELNELRTRVIVETGIYTDIMSSSYEIFPFFYNRYSSELEKKLNEIQILNKKKNSID